MKQVRRPEEEEEGKGRARSGRLGGLSLSGCLCCRQARMPSMPGRAPVEGGRSGMGCGFGGGGAGVRQTGNQRLGRPATGKGRTSGGREGRRAQCEKRQGIWPRSRERTRVLRTLLAHSDARRTNQPAPPPARLLELSTVSRACLSVCLSVSVRSGPSFFSLLSGRL